MVEKNFLIAKLLGSLLLVLIYYSLLFSDYLCRIYLRYPIDTESHRQCYDNRYSQENRGIESNAGIDKDCIR